jgi:excisionase family DNA binding protein
MTPNDEALLVSREEAARRLGISTRYLDTLIRDRGIAVVGFGRRCVRLSVTDLIQLIDTSRALDPSAGTIAGCDPSGLRT